MAPRSDDQERVERVDEVRVVRLLVKDVDRGAEARQDVHEGRVLATRNLQVAGVEEAVRGVIERPPECCPGRLHEHVPQRGGHALRAVRPCRDHGRRIAGANVAE